MRFLLSFLWLTLILIFLSFFTADNIYAQSDYNFDWSLDKTTNSIEKQVRDDVVDQKGSAAINTLVFRIIQNIVIPLMIFWGIILAIIWFYKLKVKEDRNEVKKSANYFVWWTIWIVVMVSARYIWNIIWSDWFSRWSNVDFLWVDLAELVYEKIAYPFLKFWLYLVLGLLFIFLVIRVFKFLTSDDNTKTSIKLLVSNVIWILTIIWSNQLVTAIYWSKEDVLNADATNIANIWSWLLSDKNIPIIYDILLWTSWLAAFVILVFMVILWIKLLTNPENEETLNEVKMYSLYSVIWLLVIWGSYMITNFLLVSW